MKKSWMSRPGNKKTPGKFQVQKEIMNFKSKIGRVVEETICKRHKANKGEPCWEVPYGICNHRASQIFTGTPSERASTPVREFNRKQKESVV